MQQEHLNQISSLTKFWSSSFFQITTPVAKYQALCKLKKSRVIRKKINLTKVFIIQVLWNMTMSRANRHVLGS
jgi:hypothetical protein